MRKAGAVSYADIPGYSDFLPVYDEAVTHFGDGAVFVEVGVAIGHSIAHLARKVIDAGHTRTRIYAVDPWGGIERNGEQQDMLRGRSSGDFRLFLDHMIANAPEELERIMVIRESSVSASCLFAAGEVSMCLIDGDHRVDAVEADIRAWESRIARDGWLCGDDYRELYNQVIQGVHRVYAKEAVEVCGQQGWTWRVRL